MPLTRAERKSHRKNSKEMLKDMLYIKRKIEFRRGKVDRKLLVQEQLQRWECREVVGTPCKSLEISHNSVGDTT